VFVDKKGHTNAPTADFIRSMREVATTLSSSYTSLLSASVRLAEAGQDQEAMRLIELAKGIQCAESKVRRHVKDAGVGKIVKMSEH
jgi:hypothetical protein